LHRLNFENEIGNFPVIEFFPFEAIEAASPLKPPAAARPADHLYRPWSDAAKNRRCRTGARRRLRVSRLGAGWEGRGQDRRHARRRKDIIDSHTKFPISWERVRGDRSRSAGRGFRTIQVCPQAPPGALRYVELPQTVRASRRRRAHSVVRHDAGSAMFGMRRREFVTLLAGAAAAPLILWPLAAGARQQTKIPRIGIIDDSPRWNAFRHGLRDLGYLEGQNIAFDYAYGDGVPERLAEAAAQLVRRPVDVIATYGTAASFAAKQATTTIPIVMISVGDPVRAGLVASLAHPGGNVTGNTILGPDIGAKWVQLLQELIPTVVRVAFLWNPNNASHAAYRQELQAAAPALNAKLLFVEVGSAGEFESAFAAMMKECPDAFSMTGDPFHQLHVGWIID